MTKRVTSRRPAGSRLWKSLTPKLLLLALVAAWFGGQELGTAVLGNPDQWSDSAEIMETRPHAPGSPADLVARHDCWTEEAPHDVAMPGHVVVTTRDGTTRYAGPRMVGRALDQVFADVDHGLTVHAFCR